MPDEEKNKNEKLNNRNYDVELKPVVDKLVKSVFFGICTKIEPIEASLLLEFYDRTIEEQKAKESTHKLEPELVNYENKEKYKDGKL